MPISSLRTSLLWGALAVLAGSAVLAVVAVLFEDVPRLANQLFGIAFNTALHALAMLIAFLIYQKHRRSGLAIVLVLLTSWLTWLVYALAVPRRGKDEFIEVASSVSVVAALSLQLGLVLLPPLQAFFWRLLRVFTIACAVVAALGLLAIITDLDDVAGIGHVVSFVTAVAFMLALLGTAMVPLASAIERSSAADGHEHDLPASVPVSLTCPHCKSDITISSQKSEACSTCRLKIRITLEEPRCACGYLLYDIRSDACPECGRAVPRTP